MECIQLVVSYRAGLHNTQSARRLTISSDRYSALNSIAPSEHMWHHTGVVSRRVQLNVFTAVEITILSMTLLTSLLEILPVFLQDAMVGRFFGQLVGLPPLSLSVSATE